MRWITAASATAADARKATPAPEETTPADSAIADTAFKNLEPAFMCILNLLPLSRSRSRLRPVCGFTGFYPTSKYGR
jgi:hypothetical protein